MNKKKIKKELKLIIYFNNKIYKLLISYIIKIYRTKIKTDASKYFHAKRKILFLFHKN